MRTSEEIMERTERFFQRDGAECEFLQEEAQALLEELDTTDTPQQQARIAVRLRAIMRSLKSMGCGQPEAS